jgi:transposase
MQGRKDIQPKMMYQVHLDSLVAQDNFYRKLNRSLDLSFLYKATEKYYGTEGPESIDPIVFFKILLIGYINNIRSDRQLIEYCSNCLDIRLYLKYDLDESLPWHSTISRTRQLYGEEVFVALFQEVLSLCIQKGMVRGKRQAIDSAFINANASLDSLLEREIIEDAKSYTKELNEGSEFHTETQANDPLDKSDKTDDISPAENESSKNACGSKLNQTHYSPTDRDARVSTKPGKAPHLNYYGQIAVDDAHHVITGAMADFADKKDCQCLPEILQKAIDNLKPYAIQIEQVCADTNYSSGTSLDFLDRKSVV